MCQALLRRDFTNVRQQVVDLYGWYKRRECAQQVCLLLFIRMALNICQRLICGPDLMCNESGQQLRRKITSEAIDGRSYKCIATLQANKPPQLHGRGTRASAVRALPNIAQVAE